MKVLVVTGGIGSGKSHVCCILKDRFGVPVYEADKRAKELYSEYPEMLDAIEAGLKTTLRTDHGDFVPKKLADIIFSDYSALLKVEEILFPFMKHDFEQWAKRQTSEVVAFESATILEKPQFAGFGDLILLVDAPMAIRLERASKRDCVEVDRVRARMDAQKLMNRLSEGESDSRIDFVLKNESTLEDLLLKISDFMENYVLTKML
jgi:dephospho-CoA kinase